MQNIQMSAIQKSFLEIQPLLGVTWTKKQHRLQGHCFFSNRKEVGGTLWERRQFTATRQQRGWAMEELAFGLGWRKHLPPIVHSSALGGLSCIIPCSGLSHFLPLVSFVTSIKKPLLEIPAFVPPQRKSAMESARLGMVLDPNPDINSAPSHS